MHWTAALTALTAFSSLVGGVLHEKRDSTPPRWRKLGRADGSLSMRIGLAQSDLGKAHEHLMDISHPKSPNYGKQWTSEQVISAFQPSDETVETVRQWLAVAGIKGVTQSENKAWLAFHASVEQAEKLLETEYFEYEDAETGGIIPACEQYHVPGHVQAHIDYATPGIMLVAPPETPTNAHRQKRSVAPHGRRSGRTPKVSIPSDAVHEAARSSNLSTCDQVITPQCIAALYNIPPSTLKHSYPNNTLGIFETEIQFWDQADLDAFFTNFTAGIPNGTYPYTINIDGGRGRANYSDEAGVEAMLDLVVALPIVYPQNITIYDVDDLNYQNWPNDTYTWGFNSLLDALDGSYCNYSAYGETGDLKGVDPTYPDPSFLGYKGTLQCGAFRPPNVMSISYGGQEAEVPISYQKRQCNEFLKLGLQGVSFLFASGDAGVAGPPPIQPGENSGTCLGANDSIFNPTWPNTCPWITNVGATKVYPGHTVNETESAAVALGGQSSTSNYSSGGGFSNIYPVPDYQQAAVNAYFANHAPAYPSYSSLASDNVTDPYRLLDIASLTGGNGTGVYNRGGRGVPDVAANGDNIAVVSTGSFKLVAGTSASAPIFAALLNRINEERLAVGKGPVGFVNPVLYDHPEVLNDVMNGTNPGCGTDGFSAVKGWDPVTGLGTPNYPKMLDLFLSLP